MKKLKKKLKKIFTKDNVVKAVIVISGLLLVLTSILPYII